MPIQTRVAYGIDLFDENDEVIASHTLNPPIVCGPRDVLDFKWTVNFQKINGLEPPENTGVEDD